MSRQCLMGLLVVGWAVGVYSGEPIVDYVQISQRQGTKLVDIEYKLTDPDGDEMVITVTGRDNVNDVAVPMRTLSGDGAHGRKVTNGVHHLVWDAGADWTDKITDDFTVTIRAWDSGTSAGEYLIIDVSAGASADSYPVSYARDVPYVAIDDIYKTSRIVLRLVPAGSFTMGSPPDELGRGSSEDQHDVILTQDVWIGVFEVTQKQWNLVMGDDPSYDRGDKRPVESVSWDRVRGGEWPGSPAGAPAGGAMPNRC